MALWIDLLKVRAFRLKEQMSTRNGPNDPGDGPVGVIRRIARSIKNCYDCQREVFYPLSTGMWPGGLLGEGVGAQSATGERIEQDRPQTGVDYQRDTCARVLKG